MVYMTNLIVCSAAGDLLKFALFAPAPKTIVQDSLPQKKILYKLVYVFKTNSCTYFPSLIRRSKKERHSSVDVLSGDEPVF